MVSQGQYSLLSYYQLPISFQLFPQFGQFNLYAKSFLKCHSKPNARETYSATYFHLMATENSFLWSLPSNSLLLRLRRNTMHSTALLGQYHGCHMINSDCIIARLTAYILEKNAFVSFFPKSNCVPPEHFRGSLSSTLECRRGACVEVVEPKIIFYSRSVPRAAPLLATSSFFPPFLLH